MIFTRKLLLSCLFSGYSISLFYAISVLTGITGTHVTPVPPIALRALTLFGIFWWIIPPLMGISFYVSPPRFFTSEYYSIHSLIFLACSFIASGATVLEVLFISKQAMPTDGVQIVGNISITVIMLIIITVRIQSGRLLHTSEIG